MMDQTASGYKRCWVHELNDNNYQDHNDDNNHVRDDNNHDDDGDNDDNDNKR